jgi:hypothetical protein
VSVRERVDLSRGSRIGATVSDYVAPTKPRTIHLIVTTRLSTPAGTPSVDSAPELAGFSEGKNRR